MRNVPFVGMKLWIDAYYEEVLSKLDPKTVYDELGEDAVIMCWESSEKFCHRHIVADWLEQQLGIKIKEIS